MNGGTIDLSNFNQTIGDLNGAAGSITLGNGTLTESSGNTTSFGGTISGPGNFTKQGSGTLILAGNNTYSGTTTIAAGTVRLGNNTTAGSVAGSIIDNGTLALDRSDNVTLANTISGSGVIDKLGSNTANLTGADSGFTGSTEVAGGTLLVNTTLGGNLTVDSGATLGGNGTVGGSVTVANGGHLAPGNSPGTVIITGNLALNSSSVLDYPARHAERGRRWRQ